MSERMTDPTQEERDYLDSLVLDHIDKAEAKQRGCQCPLCTRPVPPGLTLEQENEFREEREVALHEWVIAHDFPPNFAVYCRGCQMERETLGHCSHEDTPGGKATL